MDKFKRPGFSIHMHDKDGDVYDEGIFLHFDDTAIKVAETFEGWCKFKEHLESMTREISENYHG